MNNYAPPIGPADLWPTPAPGDTLAPEPPSERIDHLLDVRFVVFRMSAGDRFGIAVAALPETGEIVGRFWQPHLGTVQRIRTDVANVRPLGEARWGKLKGTCVPSLPRQGASPESKARPAPRRARSFLTLHVV